MVDARRVLDLLVGASSRPGSGGTPGGFLQGALDAFGKRGQGGQGGQAPADLARTAKDFMNRHPGLAEAALMSIAGILLGSRRGRGIARGVAGLGGLVVIGGLAYQALQNYRSGKPLLNAAAAPPSAALPGPAAFDLADISEEDALLFARAMVAAATADGHIDEAERTRILGALSQAGMDAESHRWLERELSDPAGIEELSERIRTPEKAAQLYAAARVAVDPDTMQEREFLRQLAAALDLDAALVRHLDDAASSVKTGAAT